MSPFLGFGQLVTCAAHNDFGPVLNKILDELLQVQRHRPALDEAHVVDTKRALQLGLFVQVVEHHAGHGVALQVVNNAHAVAVRLVAHVRNAVDDLVVDERRGFLNHRRLVHHVGNLGDDDLLLAGFAGFKRGLGPHDDPAPTRFERLLHAFVAVNDAAGGEVGGRDVLHELGHRNGGVGEIGNDAVHYFRQVMGRHVGGHAHGDAGSTVHQQVRKLGGHHAGLLQRVVEVGLKINRVLVQVVEHFVGDALEAGLGVAHGGRRVAVDRAKVALTVHQRIAQAPVLGHAHHGVVHGRIAVRVVFTQHLSHDAGRFFVRFIVAHAQLAHAIEHTPMHGLEAIAHIGQSPGDDDRHRIIDVRAPHLVFDVYRNDFFAFRH